MANSENDNFYPPAVCDACGVIFQQRHLALSKDVSNISLINFGIGPCPNCGGTGHIPSGVYSVIGTVLSAFGATPEARREIAAIAAIFREAKDQRASAEHIAQKIRAQTPTLARIADLLPNDRADLYAFLSMGIAAASLYLQLSGKDPAPSIEVNQVINQVTIEAAPLPNEAKKADTKPRFKKEKRRLKKGQRNGRRDRQS
jgi:hypothetical protein